MLDWLKATGCIFALFLGVFALASAAQAGPEDGRIVNGSGSISQSGTHTDIRQNSDFLATHWGSFNIAAHESVQAHQPGASSRLLIRVDGGAATNIAGNYTSNGITILENQNGVQFSRGAIVNVGGLLATSSRISGVAGANWQLNGTGGAVVNHGQIAAGAGGVVLAAVRVENHGKITAQGGDVALGAGSAFTVDFAGSLVGFEVKKAADGASVVHDGVIESQGGIVSLSAQEAQAVRTNVVSVGGVVKATKMERRGGVVYLSGGDEGIAEVSGDVSASDKVQTTGEYVVVKEGALLKAPEILVGGDFQGKGDVQTAKRTLVERGALLDAGAGGRVIVWSDDVTWFNGDISAPDGFAEVSGKETLASVHLAGIDVGELLLDPEDIIISSATTATAVTDNILAADPGMTLTLDVATINDFAGALSLAASDTIMVDGEINKPTGNLTLIAGGVLTINANITTSAGDLALTGASIALTAETTTLTGGAISLTGVINETGSDARNLTINASGILTLNSDITLPTGGITGRLEITAFRVNLPSAIALAPSRLLIVFNDPAAVDFEASFDGAGVAGSTFPGIVSDIIRTIFTYAPRDCGGEAVCELTSMDNVDEIGQGFRLSPMLTANDSIMIRAERSDLIFSGTEAISITAPIVSIQARSINIGGRNFTITANGGTLTLAANITTTGDITLSSTGMNAGITLMFNIELAGRDISLTGAIDEPSGATNSFVATASRRLTLNDNINVGTNGLGLTGTGGITLANAAGLTLRGGAVTLTGVVTADNTPLTIEAQDGIVINNNIDIGAGRLELIAGLGDGGTAFINVHDARPDPDDDTVQLTITAGSFLWAQDAQFNASDTPPANFVLPDEVRIEGIYFGTLSPVNNPAWLDVRQFQGVRYMLGDGMGDVVVPQAATSALESITLNAAADSTISFGGTGAITLSAPQITITAGTIIIGEGRTLTINAEGGTLTLNLDDIIISGAATAGSVTLSAAAIVNDAALILNVATVNIAQDGEFGAAAPFTFPAGVTTLNLSTQAAQAYRGWMTAPNPGPDRSVSLMSAGVITVGQSINLETGNLSLNGTGGIVLGGGNIGLAGNTVILTGAIDEAATSTDNLTIAAVDDITLNSNIDLGMGALRLTAGIGSPDGNIGNGGTPRRIDAGSLHLQTDTGLSVTLFTTSSRVGGAVEIRYGTGAISSAFEPWLLSLGQGDLSVRGIDGVTPTTSLTISANIMRTEGVVDIRWLTLALLGNSSIEARAITLHVDTLGANILTATDGDITFRGADGTGSPGYSNSYAVLTLRQNGAFGATAPLTFGSESTLALLTLTTAADQIVQGWMTTSGRSLSVTSGGVLTLNDNINIGGGDLTLDGAGGIVLRSDATTTLSARDITLNGAIDNSANNRDFDVVATRNLSFLDTTINVGTGDITLRAEAVGGNVLESGQPAITLTGEDVELNASGQIVTASRSIEIRANGNILLAAEIGGINVGTGALDLRADEDNVGGGTITGGTAAPRVVAGSLFLQQAGGFVETLFAENSTVSGSVSLRTTATGVNQTIQPWMAALGNGDFSLAGEGVVLNRIIISAAFTRSAGEVDLRATSIIFDAPLTGTSVILRTNSVLQSDSNTNPVAIHATAGDITSTRINTSTGEVDTGRPPTLFSVLLGGSSFTLEQTSAFGALDTLPFEFAPPSITAITLVTRSAQAVQTWMVASGRSLSLTTSQALTVNAREIQLGTGDLTLSGASIVSTDSGGLGITANDVTLTGAMTLTGPLVVVAGGASSTLTLGGSIFAGASDITLGATGGIVLGGDVELRGGVIRLNSAVDGTTGNRALSVLANGNIFLGGVITLGSGALLLSADEDNNRSGNISFGGGAAQREIAVGALTLRQVSAFGETLFASGSTASGAVVLRPRSAVIQPIHPWIANLGTGSFSLRGVEGITLTAINIGAVGLERTVGAVDLQATTISLGGDITGDNGITLMANTINLNADDIEISSGGSLTITGVIDGSANNRDLSATAAVRLTLNSNINLGTGNLSLLGVGIFVLGGDITITGGEVVISNAIQSAAGVNPNFTVNASNSISIRSVNLGTGNLTLNNMGATDIAMSLAASWNARNITLTGAIDDSANNRNLTINASGVLTLNDDINLGERNLNINAMGGITLGGNVTLTSRVTILRGAVDGTNGNHNFTIMDSAGSNLHNDINLGSGTFTLANTGSGQVNFSIVGSVGAPLTIEAGNINFMRSNSVVWVLQAGVVAQGADLTLRATGDITFQGTVINLGPGRLEISADNEGNGTGTIIAGNTPEIIAGSLVLRHAAAFSATLLADDSAITGAVDLRITGAMVTQAIHPWMNLGGTSFTLRGDEGEGARAAVVLTAITLPAAIDFGTTDIDLQAAAITLTAATTLTGGAISLTGAIDASANNRNLTITASGLLTLNNDINLGTGALIINAGNRINVPNRGTTITASANNIIFTDRLVQSFEAGFTPVDGTPTFGNVTFVPPATSTFPPPPCLADPCEFGDGTTEDLIVDSLLEAMTSITIDIGTGALTFGGEGAITITSPIISITAGSIDIGTRSLTITAAGAGGTITLVGVTSITGTGAGAVSLDAATIMGLRSALTVNVPSISLAQEAAFGGGDTAPFTFGAAVTSLTLTVAMDQTVQGWMVADGRSLSLTSTGGRITATADINTGSGDIILNGAGGLTLGRAADPSNITLTGGDVSLTGATSNNRGFTVAASGVLTLNSNIALISGATLNLTGTSGIILGGDITISGGASINLTGAIEGAGNSLTIRATGTILLGGNINLDTGNLILSAGEGAAAGVVSPASGILTLTAASVSIRQDRLFGEWTIVSPILTLTTDAFGSGNAIFAQPVAAWMLPSAGTNRALSLTAGGDITVGSGMDLSGVDLTLTTTATIALGGDLTALSVALRASAITRDSATLTITATTGGITGNAPALDSTVTALTLIAQSAFASSAPFTFDAALASLTLQTAAAQTVHSWMGVSGSNLSLTSTGVITVNTNIALGTGNLTLTGATIQIGLAFGTPANTRIVLRGQDVTLTAADGILLGRFTESGRFRVNLDVASLTVRADGTLTIAADITAADGIRSGGDIRFVGSDAASPIAFTGARTITGRAIELTGVAAGTADLTITASGTLTLNNDITLTGAGFTLALSGAGAIVGTGRPRLTADMVSFSQVDALPVTRPFRFIPGSSLAIIAEAAQDVHDWMIRENIGLTVTSSNRVRVVALIGTGGAAGRNLGTGNITLTSTGGAVRILAGISTTGSITLIGVTGGINFNSGAGAKTFSGAAITLSGDVRSDRDLAITASGTLRINNDINIGTNALTLTSGVGAIVATGRPRLTAGMVSFSQVDALPVTRPFRFIPGSSLAITTEAAQDVHDWMIRENIDLTVTSSNRVRVVAIIGTGGVAGRNLGTGALSLTSTGGAVRILANISISNNITLIGGAGGINLNGTATLTGAAITLTGDARGNRALTLDASGTLRINSNIALTDAGNLTLRSDTVVRILAGDISTGGNITLSGVTGGINFNNGAAAKTLSGAAITLTGAARSNRDLALTASGTLTLNNDIDIGTGNLTLTSGVGAIVATGRPRLTAGMVSFSQVDALPVTRPFRFIPSSSLAITTEAAQDVHDWMIRENIDLTVTSSNRVRVVAIIGTGGVAGRNLGTGALSLTSTGGAVRILANISISNNITLSGVTDGINLNGTDTLTGAIITLTGDARGNRDLTITATGVLTINNNIDIGTTGTTLTLTGASLTFGLSVDLTAGAYSLSDGRACNTGTMPSCTTITP